MRLSLSLSPLCRVCLVLIFLLTASNALADRVIGIGYVESMTGLNLEYMAEKRSFYGIIGAHLSTTGYETDDMRWVIGTRKRIDRSLMMTKGFYTGFLAGDLGGRKQYERLGLGWELGHQWLTEHTRSTVSAGFAVLEEIEERNLDVEPGFFIGLTWGIRR
jgi:hypothetical protein